MFPGQELLELLNQIRGYLTPDEVSIPLRAFKYRLDRSGIERTLGLLKNMGDDCSYYRKSLDIFLRKDYNDIYKIIMAIPEADRDSEIDRVKELMEEIGVEGW